MGRATELGIALITVLLVVALATITAVAMTTRQQLDIHRTANVINGEQAYIYALGGESWVKRILLRDGKNSSIDSLSEIWATPIPPLPIPGGTLFGQIEDLQGRFNLNNLVQNGKANSQSIIIFERLLRVLELYDLFPQLAPVIVDWIDDNLETGFPVGAEDDTYLLNKPAYRTSNTLLSSPSEIRLLADFDNDSYQKLLPYISTLPTRTLINVNTAPLPILMALAEGLNEADAITIIATRDKKPFESVQDFLAHDALTGLKVETESLSVVSAYFLLMTQVQIDRVQTKLSSVLYRLSNLVTVIMRVNGEL
jgi:general secretion pathway protein K